MNTSTALPQTDVQAIDTPEAAARQLSELFTASRILQARRVVKDYVARWPESARLQHWDRVLEPPRVIGRRPASLRDLAPEKAWIAAHRDQYRGCWIALVGSRLVAADPQASVVRAAARAYVGRERPIVHQIPP